MESGRHKINRLTAAVKKPKIIVPNISISARLLPPSDTPTISTYICDGTLVQGNIVRMVLMSKGLSGPSHQAQRAPGFASSRQRRVQVPKVQE